MSDWIVVSHVHDTDGGMYRMTVGQESITQEPTYDAEGAAIFDEDGNPRTVEVAVTTPLLEFVFADDDDRWKGKSEKAIAKAQRTEIKKHLAKLEAAQPAAAKPKPLTDGGERL